MDCWENYLNSTKELDILIQLAIIHVEFEGLHPFQDGNGRLGRMLIPLFLFQRLVVESRFLHERISGNRDEYQEYLRAVSRDGSM